MFLSLKRHTTAAALVAAVWTVGSSTPSAQQAQPPQPRSVFRSRLNLISVDVIVRDKAGTVVRGLTANDFEIREDGRVWAWGENDLGEVGDGTMLKPYGPAPLPGPERTRSVAAGFGFSLAVDGRGDAWFRGTLLDPAPRDADGVRLGNPWPQRLDGIPPVRAAAAGGWDHAVLLMEAARHWGFGARFVTGYIQMNDDQHGATHAWTEIYIPGAGWLGFDPTNNIFVGA